MKGQYRGLRDKEGDKVAIKTKSVLKRIGDSQREIGYIMRDLMHLEEEPKQKLLYSLAVFAVWIS
jgi:hypothetical protein